MACTCCQGRGIHNNPSSYAVYNFECRPCEGTGQEPTRFQRYIAIGPGWIEMQGQASAASVTEAARLAQYLHTGGAYAKHCTQSG